MEEMIFTTLSTYTHSLNPDLANDVNSFRVDKKHFN